MKRRKGEKEKSRKEEKKKKYLSRFMLKRYIRKGEGFGILGLIGSATKHARGFIKK